MCDLHDAEKWQIKDVYKRGWTEPAECTFLVTYCILYNTNHLPSQRSKNIAPPLVRYRVQTIEVINECCICRYICLR